MINSNYYTLKPLLLIRLRNFNSIAKAIAFYVFCNLGSINNLAIP